MHSCSIADDLEPLGAQRAARMESSEYDGAFKRRAPARAARRRQVTEDEDPDSSVPTAPAAAKKSGWGDSPGGNSGSAEEGGGSTGGGGAGRRRRRAADNDDEASAEPPSSAVVSSSLAHMNDDDEGTTEYIPDLEDEEENISQQIAVAPEVKSSRVPTIADLDEEIDMALPSTTEIGVDLSVLQQFLIPQEQLVEEDVPWDFEHELQTLAHELQQEQEEREGTALPGQVSPKRKPKAAVVAVE